MLAKHVMSCHAHCQQKIPARVLPPDPLRFPGGQGFAFCEFADADTSAVLIHKVHGSRLFHKTLTVKYAFKPGDC